MFCLDQDSKYITVDAVLSKVGNIRKIEYITGHKYGNYYRAISC